MIHTWKAQLVKNAIRYFVLQTFFVYAVKEFWSAA